MGQTDSLTETKQDGQRSVKLEVKARREQEENDQTAKQRAELATKKEK